MDKFPAQSTSRRAESQVDAINREPLSDQKRDAFAQEIFVHYSRNPFAQESKYHVEDPSLEELKTYLDNMYYADGNKDEQELAYLEVGFQLDVAKKYLALRSPHKKAA